MESENKVRKLGDTALALSNYSFVLKNWPISILTIPLSIYSLLQLKDKSFLTSSTDMKMRNSYNMKNIKRYSSRKKSFYSNSEKFLMSSKLPERLKKQRKWVYGTPL